MSSYPGISQYKSGFGRVSLFPMKRVGRAGKAAPQGLARAPPASGRGALAASAAGSEDPEAAAEVTICWMCSWLFSVPQPERA